MDETEPLEQFRAYYTRELAAGDHEEAIRLSRAETGLYRKLRDAYYAAWKARGELPPPPVEVPEDVKRALEVLQGYFGTGDLPALAIRAAAAGLGGGYTHTEGPLAPLPLPQQAHWSRPPVHQSAASISGTPFISAPVAGPPPVTNIRDYQTDLPADLPQSGPRGATCPSCQSADRDTRLGVWSPDFGETVACPDKWHSPGNDRRLAMLARPQKWAGTVTGRLKPGPAGYDPDETAETTATPGHES